MWLGAVSVAHYLGVTEADRVLAVLPLAFDYGQNQLLSTWFAGGAVVPLDYLTPRDVMKAVERHDVTTIAAVPPLWLQLAELDMAGGDRRAAQAPDQQRRRADRAFGPRAAGAVFRKAACFRCMA